MSNTAATICQRLRKVIKFKETGFTLVEVLLSATVVAYAAVFIFGAFFKSLSAIDHARDRLNVMNTCHNELLNIKYMLENDKIDMPYTKSGKFRTSGKVYGYKIGLKRDESREGLCNAASLFNWREGNKDIEIKRYFVWPVKKREKDQRH